MQSVLIISPRYYPLDIEYRPGNWPDLPHSKTFQKRKPVKLLAVEFSELTNSFRFKTHPVNRSPVPSHRALSPTDRILDFGHHRLRSIINASALKVVQWTVCGYYAPQNVEQKENDRCCRVYNVNCKRENLKNFKNNVYECVWIVWEF